VKKKERKKGEERERKEEDRERKGKRESLEQRFKEIPDIYKYY